MNNNMTLMQLAHCNVRLFKIAIANHTRYNFTKSTSASGIGHTSTIPRRWTSGSTLP
jgi:hypothetical protein